MEKYTINQAKVKKWFIIILAVAAVLALLISVCSVYVNYLEMKEIGGQYISVFWMNFNVRMFSFFACFIASFAVLLANTVVLRKNLYNKGAALPLYAKPGIYLVFDGILALILGICMSQSIYDKVLLYLNSTGFNLGDPIFNQDIGYYIFQRPFYHTLIDIIFFLLVFAAVLTALLYIASYILNRVLLKRILYDRPILLHICVNVALCIFSFCFSFKMKSEDILFSQFSGLTGAGYTDVNLWRMFYQYAPYLLAAIVLLGFYFAYIRRMKWKQMIAVALIYPIAFLAVSAVALSVQRLYVAPNESIVEKNHIEYNIQATRAAYNLDEITTREFNLKNDLSAQDIEKNADSIYNLRTVDYSQTLAATNQLQSIRNYYTFKDSDTVVYNIGGKKTALNGAVRELDLSKLDDAESKKFVNRRLRFTHGYGIVMNPLNLLNEEGQPQYVVKDIPTFSYQGAPYVSEPRIYYGEMKNDYVIANSYQKEFDYSEGNVDVETSYQGASGIQLNFINKLIYSLRFGDLNLLISNYISPESKLLVNRNITERVSMVAPFLTLDPDPYPVVDDEGRIKWVVDAYTTSSDYPYAKAYNGINYIRHAARAIVDAYDGTVTFYVVDESDPIIQTYRKIYPGMFSQEPLPADLASKVTYPESLFKVQAAMFTTYHVTDAAQLYNKTDVWTVAKEKYANDIKEVEPYFNLMSLDEESPDELFLMLPFTIRNKDNMVAWLAAQSEGENYGKLTCITFPAGQNVYGPLQIDNRIDSDSVISKELSLWSQGGSNVIRGNMLVVPIERTLLYIEPVYITSSTENNIPEMKRVIVACGNNIVMEPTLQQAFAKLFNVNIDPALSPETGQEGGVEIHVEDTLDTLIDKAVQMYEKVEADLKAGDFKKFGEDFENFSSVVKLIKAKRLEGQSVQRTLDALEIGQEESVRVEGAE